MTADGNLISKGQGEGEAIMIQPFLPDQTPFNQMNKALMQQKAQKAQVGMANQREAEGSRDAWLKKLSNANYNRLDEPAIRKLQDKIIESITSYKTGDPKTNIEQQLAAFEYLTKTSQESLKGDNEIQSDMIKNADKIWYKGQDDWTKAQVENTAETYEDAIKAIARRDAARKSVVQGGEKINEPIPYLDKIVQKASMTSNEPVQYKGADGTLITKYETFTDPKKLRETVEFDYNNNPEAQRVFGSAEEMYNQADKRAVYKKSINVKGQTSAAKQNKSVGGGTISVGNVVLNPPIKSNQAQTLLQDNAWSKYKKAFEDAQEKINLDPSLTTAQKDQRKLALKKQFKTEADFKSKFSFSNDSEVIPYSVKGLPENSTHQFTTVIDGKDVQIDGQSNLFNPKSNAFVVETSKGTFLAPVNKNTQYLSDNGMTIEDLNKAVSKVGSGNVVTTNREGDIIKTEKVEIKVGDKRNGKKITNVGRNKQGVVVKVQYSDGTIEDL
ncbi:MAG: hypothetical protein IPP56_13460 [Bacteroidetes bacterium]|nr:hypothetical protein [Bacteroidota bacterium]